MYLLTQNTPFVFAQTWDASSLAQIKFLFLEF